MTKKVLILGSTGMLGVMVHKYLSKFSKHTITGSTRQRDKTYFDAEEFIKNPQSFSSLLSYDYIINCVGIIKPYCKDNDPTSIQSAIKINALFPHILSDYCRISPVRIIQIATDCVFSGTKGNYLEDSPHDALDVYGKTKSLGEVFTKNVLNIRCSIIGPELKNKLSLLEWFLSQKNGSAIHGFVQHKWNGVTTLQFAKLCLKIIDEDVFTNLTTKAHVYHFIPNNSVSKYDLLLTLKKVFLKDITIIKSGTNEIPINRILSTKYKNFTSLYGNDDLTKALHDLKNFIEKDW